MVIIQVLEILVSNIEPNIAFYGQRVTSFCHPERIFQRFEDSTPGKLPSQRQVHRIFTFRHRVVYN